MCKIYTFNSLAQDGRGIFRMAIIEKGQTLP